MKSPGGRRQRAHRARKEPRRGAKPEQDTQIPSEGTKDAQHPRKRVADADKVHRARKEPQKRAKDRRTHKYP